MKASKYIIVILIFSMFNFINATEINKDEKVKKKLVYIVSDIRIPFWDIMKRGIENTSATLGYELDVYSSNNDAKKELELTIKAIKNRVSGIIVSPTNSSACVTILKLAKSAGIPVVISDIGTDGGEYVSYVSSNNKDGAYKLGKVLVKRMTELGWQEGSVGIVAIPQKRLNGQARTSGFMQALDEAGIKGADIKQQITWTQEETYNYSKEMIATYPNLRAIWLQSSNRYLGALKAIQDAGKQDEILLISFDAEPIFLELIPKKILVGAAMQQPFLMGEEAAKSLHNHLNGKEVEKNLQLPILAVSSDNISELLPIINRNVLGIK